MSTAFEEGLSQSLLDEFFLTTQSTPLKLDRKLQNTLEISQEVLDEFLSCQEDSQHKFSNLCRGSLQSSIPDKRSSTASDQIIPQDLLEAFLTFQDKDEAKFIKQAICSSTATKKHGPIFKSPNSLAECSPGKDLDTSRDSEYDLSDEGLLEVLYQISTPAAKRKQDMLGSIGKRVKLNGVNKNV